MMSGLNFSMRHKSSRADYYQRDISVIINSIMGSRNNIRSDSHARKMLTKQGVKHAVNNQISRKSAGVRLHEVDVKDGYHHRRYKLERLGSQLFAAQLERFLAKRSHIDFKHEKNRVRKILYMIPAFKEWSGFMPGALALEPIHHPEQKKLVSGKRIDPMTRRLFRHGLDPIGVRSRTLVGGNLAHEYVESNKPNELRWVSLAGGTAAPSMLMIHASKIPAQKVKYLNIDIDKKSIGIADEITKIEGIPKKQTSNVVGDIFDKKLIAKHIKSGQADIVDLMGIFEYLDDNQSKDLLNISYGLLKSGGQIIACNMRDDHPQLNLHKRGVGWPGVIPRKVKDVAAMIKKSGIDLENVDIYQSKDGVYNVISIKKV